MKPTALIHIVVLSYGWRRWLIAFAAGALSAAAMAPLNFWPILFVTFPVLVWLIDGAGAGQWRGITGAAATGWWFGFGYFLAGLYWIGFAFLVDAPTFGWLLPIAVGGLPAGLAIFTAFGVALARLLWTRGPLRILALAIALTASEWLRGHVLTGFPWNAFGYALTSPLVLAQSAALCASTSGEVSAYPKAFHGNPVRMCPRNHSDAVSATANARMRKAPRVHNRRANATPKAVKIASPAGRPTTAMGRSQPKVGASTRNAKPIQ